VFTVAKFNYQPPDSKYDVPQGTYVAKFIALRERHFDQPSKFGGDGPRHEWQFEVVEGPQRGKVVAKTTGTDPTSPKSGCFKMLKGLLGRPPDPGEDIDTDAYVGRLYEVEWEPNPDSPQKNLSITTLRPYRGAVQQPAPASAPGAGPTPPGNGAAPPPRQGPPPRKAPAAAAPPARRFYVYTTQDDSGDPVTMDEKELHDYVHTSQRAPGTVTVCAVGEDEWKTALDYGIQDTIPW
jgi:hypothetical protein